MSKFVFYLREMVTCLRLGSSWADKLKLIAVTFEFHLANLLRLPESKVPASIELDIGGRRHIHLRPRSGDVFIFHEIFTSLCYSIPEELRPRPVSVIIDLGANIGLTTLFWSRQFRDAKFVCVEPNPANMQILRRNLSFLGTRLSAIEAAVSSRSGNGNYDDSDSTWGGRLDVSGKRIVRCVSMAEILRTAGVDHADIVKVDIEGAERDVLANSPEWLNKIKTVVIELHGTYSITQLHQDVTPTGLRVLPASSSVGNVMVMAVRDTQPLLV